MRDAWYATGMHTVVFYFEFASTYSYPAMMRVEAVARAAGVPFELTPFLLGPIFAAQGWNNSPFNLYPAKGRYMWRDLERTCARFGLELQRPSEFPRNGLLAARLTTAAHGEPFQLELVRRIYRENFVHDHDIADANVLRPLLVDLVDDPAAWLARAAAPQVKAQLRANTDLAVERGVFGAPSFWVDGELYWGHDRMDEAFEHAARA